MKIKTLLRFLKIRIQKAKAAAQESLHIEDCLNTATNNEIIRHEKEPFEYVVIDNFFSEEIYEGLCAYVHNVKKRGFSESPSTTKFYPFKYVTGYLEKYGGYFYPPRHNENKFMDIFFSVRWNLFIEKLMGQNTNEFISTTVHLHTEGNKNGWVHNDYQKVFFNRKDTLSNGMVTQSNTEDEFTDEAFRSIAVLYYFDNDTWKDGDGGETGIFSSPSSGLFAKVAPKNNRLLVMKISPKSFHAFMGNKTDRNAIVQWFHVDTEEALKEYE
ncbi:MAG: 2OG-Fe(II) oxygenase [Candidatus Paceibacterota bacterium]